MTLGEKILFYRKQNKLSQEELAALVGVSRQAVSKWELGEATPEVEKLLALARAFAITTDELLSPDEPKTQKSRSPRRESRTPAPHPKPLIRIKAPLPGVRPQMSCANTAAGWAA